MGLKNPCPCNQHELHPPPDPACMTCCGVSLVLGAGVKRFGRCLICGVTWWSNPWQGDRLERVSLAGLEQLRMTLVFGHV